MKTVLAHLQGTGSDTDPFRVGFPTYSLLAMSSASRLAVVDVPDADVPTKAPQGVLVAPWVPLGQVTVHYYTRAVRKEWNDLIRRRYGGAHAEWDAAKVVAPLPP